MKEKIAQQQQFVGWWKQHVTPGWGKHGRPDKNTGLHSYSVKEAEQLTRVWQQQVSRMDIALLDVPAYRAP